jgi:peptidoglycan/xylan/chitin deacetylase (PgdA/CDA1 family)
VSRIPILCYHNIGPSPPGARFGLLYTNPDRFERQLWTLHRLGLRGVAVQEGLRHLSEGARSNLVMLTFDDGYVDTLTVALPLLKKYAFTATCYVVSDRIGTHNHWDSEYLREKKPLMSLDQLQQWLAAGMELGSHSRSHPRLRELDAAAAGREIDGSRAALRAMFGVPVEHFSYPYGSFDDSTLELVKSAGYRSAVSVVPGHAGGSDDRYRLPRILVNGQHGWWQFLLRVATPYENLRHRRRTG